MITLPAKGLSPSARVRGAACRRRPPTPSQRRWYSTAHARRRSLARCLWGGGAALELPLRARRAAVVVVGPHAKSSHCAGEWALSFGTSPWCDVLSAASNSKPPPLVSHGARAPALARSRCLWGGDAALELAARARRAAVVVVGPHAKQEHCTGERPLLFGASPWCNVVLAASNSKPAPLVLHGVRTPALARSLSLGRRRSTRACCARAPCRGCCGRPTR